MTDLRTEIQSAIMDHIHEVRGVAALTDAIMVAVEKHENTLLMHLAYIRQKSGVGMKPTLSELADAIAERIASLREERDAAFAMSRCECGTDEACANMVSKDEEIEALRRDNDSFNAVNTGLVHEVGTLRQQLADERNKAFEQAAAEMDKRSKQGRGMEASACYRNAAAAIRAMKDKP